MTAVVPRITCVPMKADANTSAAFAVPDEFSAMQPALPKEELQRVLSDLNLAVGQVQPRFTQAAGLGLLLLGAVASVYSSRAGLTEHDPLVLFRKLSSATHWMLPGTLLLALGARHVALRIVGLLLTAIGVLMVGFGHRMAIRIDNEQQAWPFAVAGLVLYVVGISCGIVDCLWSYCCLSKRIIAAVRRQIQMHQERFQGCGVDIELRHSPLLGQTVASSKAKPGDSYALVVQSNSSFLSVC